MGSAESEQGVVLCAVHAVHAAITQPFKAITIMRATSASARTCSRCTFIKKLRGLQHFTIGECSMCQEPLPSRAPDRNVQNAVSGSEPSSHGYSQIPKP